MKRSLRTCCIFRRSTRRRCAWCDWTSCCGSFQAEGEARRRERVREVARLGRRRAEMISRNHKVEAEKRAEKEEVAHWFAIWLETPGAFFDWLEVRKQSPEFQRQFPPSSDDEA